MYSACALVSEWISAIRIDNGKKKKGKKENQGRITFTLLRLLQTEKISFHQVP